MNREKIVDCYNKTAAAYASSLFDELEKKPLDRLLLKQFANKNKSKGKMIDLGCGPGQTTRFLGQNGVNEIIGIDISPGMIEKARELNESLEFQVADILNLGFADRSFASAVGFYAIVHFTMDQLKQALVEINRVLISGGQFLFSFHIGTEVIHLDEFFDKSVDIDFYFFQTQTVMNILKEANFNTIDAIERFPYENVEHQTKRAYLWAEKI